MNLQLPQLSFSQLHMRYLAYFMHQRDLNNKIALLSSSPWTSNRLWFGNHLLLTWKISKGNTLEGDGRYDSEPLILLTCGFPSLVGSEGKIELECKFLISSKLMKCVWICLHWICVVKLVFLPLCTAFVPYCFTVQPLIALAGEEDLDTRWEFGRYIPHMGRREESVLLCSHFCCPYMDAQPNRTAVAWSGRPDGTMASFVFNTAVCSVTVTGILCRDTQWLDRVPRG